MKKKVTTAILVALIATSSIVVAFAVSGKQGYISPKAILPGAITSDHIKDNDIKSGDICNGDVDTVDIANSAVTSVKINTGAVKEPEIDTDAVSSNKIKDNTIKSIDIHPNIIPTVMYETTEILSTKDSQYDPQNTAWNTTITLPSRLTYDYNLSVYWTANDAWVSYTATELLVRCQLDDTVIVPNEYKIADDTNSNLTASCVFHGTATQGTTPIISIQIRSNSTHRVGVNNQILFAAAYPAA